MCKFHGQPTCLISYNLYPHTIALARYARARFGIPWVCIVADAPAPGRQRDQHDKMLHEAAGRVFLSWKCFADCHLQPTLHLDGGIDALRFSPNVVPAKNEKKAVLYSGVMNQYGGVSFLLNAFKLIGDKSIELWLCGKGENTEVLRAAKRDSRIKCFGMVSEDELERFIQRCKCFC